MIAPLLLLAAAAASPPEAERAPPAGWSDARLAARAEARVAVQIVAGARFAASEQQHSALPPMRDSMFRDTRGQASPARLVEFE